jgi:hypothetical protein
MKNTMSLLSALYIAESALTYTISVVEKEPNKDERYYEHIAEKKAALAVIKAEIKKLRK